MKGTSAGGVNETWKQKTWRQFFSKRGRSFYAGMAFIGSKQLVFQKLRLLGQLNSKLTKFKDLTL